MVTLYADVPEDVRAFHGVRFATDRGDAADGVHRHSWHRPDGAASAATAVFGMQPESRAWAGRMTPLLAISHRASNLILEDLMDEYEMVRRVRVLPDQFASRLDEATNRGLRSMNGGGEWDELIDLLVAALIDIGAAVTPAEQQELSDLLDAMHMPTDQLQQLSVARPGEQAS